MGPAILSALGQWCRNLSTDTSSPQALRLWAVSGTSGPHDFEQRRREQHRWLRLFEEISTIPASAKPISAGPVISSVPTE